MQEYRYLTHAEKLLVNDFRKRSGSNISDIRRKKRVTLKRLARLTGYRIETIDMFELGKKPMRIEDMIKLANALETSIESIIVK